MRGTPVLFAVLALACADTSPVTLDPPSFTLTIGNKRQVAVLLGGQPLALDPSVRPV